METRARALVSQAAGGFAAGVFVELFDAAGHCLGQAVYLDWNARPLPAVGDTLAIDATQPWSLRGQLKGRVRARHFDVQTDDAGQVCVWVRLDLEELPRQRRPRRAGGSRVEFSRN